MTRCRFDDIYDCALREDAEALKQMLADGACIDEWGVGKWRCSAATQLAQECNWPACEFLLAHGANIDYVAMGAGCHGDTEHLRELAVNYNASFSACAWGAAIGGHVDFLIRLVDKGASLTQACLAMGQCQDEAAFQKFCDHFLPVDVSPEDLKNRLKWLAKGAAFADLPERLDALIQRGVDKLYAFEGAIIAGHWSSYSEKLNPSNHISPELIGAFALGGHEDKLFKYLLEIDPSNRPDYYFRVTAFAGVSGRHRLFSECFEHYKNSPEQAKQIIHSVASGGHMALADQLCAQNPEVYAIWAICGAAQGGFRKLINDLLNKYGNNISVQQIAQVEGNAMRGGHTAHLAELQSYRAYREDESKLWEKLWEKGLRYVSVLGDGSCFFYAVGLQCNQTAAELRKKVADYMRKNATDLQPFSETLILERATTIETTSEAADNLEIIAMQNILNRPIIIVRIDGTCNSMDNERQFVGEPVFVFFKPNQNELLSHYDALLVRDGFNARNILLKLLPPRAPLKQNIFTVSKATNKKIEGNDTTEYMPSNTSVVQFGDIRYKVEDVRDEIGRRRGHQLFPLAFIDSEKKVRKEQILVNDDAPTPSKSQ